jgi:hypothetical protein
VADGSRFARISATPVNGEWLIVNVRAHLGRDRLRGRLSDEDADDVEMAVIERALEETIPIWDGRTRATLSVMLKLVVHWTIVDQLRRIERERCCSLYGCPWLGQWPPTPLDVSLWKEKHGIVRRALDALPAHEADAIFSRSRGERLEDQAKRGGRSPAQISRRFTSAMRKVRAAA